VNAGFRCLAIQTRGKQPEVGRNGESVRYCRKLSIHEGKEKGVSNTGRANEHKIDLGATRGFGAAKKEKEGENAPRRWGKGGFSPGKVWPAAQFFASSLGMEKRREKKDSSDPSRMKEEVSWM